MLRHYALAKHVPGHRIQGAVKRILLWLANMRGVKFETQKAPVVLPRCLAISGNGNRSLAGNTVSGGFEPLNANCAMPRSGQSNGYLKSILDSQKTLSFYGHNSPHGQPIWTSLFFLCY